MRARGIFIAVIEIVQARVDVASAVVSVGDRIVIFSSHVDAPEYTGYAAAVLLVGIWIVVPCRCVRAAHYRQVL